MSRCFKDKDSLDFLNSRKDDSVKQIAEQIKELNKLRKLLEEKKRLLVLLNEEETGENLSEKVGKQEENGFSISDSRLKKREFSTDPSKVKKRKSSQGDSSIISILGKRGRNVQVNKKNNEFDNRCSRNMEVKRRKNRKEMKNQQDIHKRIHRRLEREEVNERVNEKEEEEFQNDNEEPELSPDEASTRRKKRSKNSATSSLKKRTITNRAKKKEKKSFRQVQKTVTPSLSFNRLKEAIWDAKFEELKTFQTKFGHTRPSRKVDSVLSNWTKLQRQLKKHQRLPQHRIDKLDSIGFQWYGRKQYDDNEVSEILKNGRDSLLAAMNSIISDLLKHPLVNSTINEKISVLKEKVNGGSFATVKEFIEEIRSVLLSHSFESSNSASNTGPLTYNLQKDCDDVNQTRSNVNGSETVVGMLSKELERLLEQSKLSRLSTVPKTRYRIDCTRKRRHVSNCRAVASPQRWQVFRWDQFYKKLRAFHRKHGHCIVQRALDPALGKWVKMQRACYANGSITSSRIARLEKLGFTWDVNASRWEIRFAELVEFHKRFGHCRVPRSSKQSDPGVDISEGKEGNKENYAILAQWIKTQRQRARVLDEDRRRRLEELGFQWKISGKLYGPMDGERERKRASDFFLLISCLLD